MPHWQAVCQEVTIKHHSGINQKSEEWHAGLRNIHHKLGCRETAYALSNEVDVNEQIKYKIFLLKSEEMVERRGVPSKFL